MFCRFLTPPGLRPPFNGDESQLQWAHRVRPSLRGLSGAPLECTVHENEVIYVPPDWWHATLNLRDYNAFISSFTLEHLHAAGL